MTPPSRSTPSGTVPSGAASEERVEAVSTPPGPPEIEPPRAPMESGTRGSSLYRPHPLTHLRPEFRSPFRSTRNIEKLGDVREAIIRDFVGNTFGPHADVVQLLGSFPGWLQPERIVNEEWTTEVRGRTVTRHWNPDEKPDLNVVGNGEGIMRRLAPLMGWDQTTLDANIARTRSGMVYFNWALETPQGPIPVKMGVIDRDVVFRGESYFSMRSWLLPAEESNVFLNSDPEFQNRYRQWVRTNKADFLRRTLGTFLFKTNLTSEDIVQRAFQLQFREYESYRIFDWFKGPNQAERLRSWLPHIFVPAIQQYLRENSDVKVYHPGRMGVALSPDAITHDNFRDLEYVIEKSFARRLGANIGVAWEIFTRNFRNGRQTFRNIGSNGTRRRGYLDVGWAEYGLRKFKRFAGINGENVARSYRPEASFFPSDAHRLGVTDTPIRQAVNLNGYDPGNESVPSVYNDDILKGARGELRKGAAVNPLFRGVEPSKFTLPVRGVPSLGYQMMNWLESAGMQHLTIVGAPDTEILYNRFLEHYAADIAARGKTSNFVPMGKSFSQNLRLGLENVPFTNEPAVVGFGDNPLIDMERIVHHPHRWVVDWIVATNSRSRMMHDSGKNYHVDGVNEGIHDPVKEGNAYTYSADVNRVPWHLLQAIFDSRKSMTEAGGRGKVSIIWEMLFDVPFRAPQWRRAATYIDSIHAFGKMIGEAIPYQISRRLLGRKVPQAALNVGMSEHVLDVRLDWTASLAPNHTDAGGVLDIDGVLDLAVAKGLMEGTDHPERIYPHWEKLSTFADALRGAEGELPALTGTAERVNNLYDRLRESFLSEGFSEELLRSKGFSKDTPPMLADGSMNPAWMDLVLPEREFQFYRAGFEAYHRRGDHAKNLMAEFTARIQSTRPAGDPLDSRIEKVIWDTLNQDPERSRAMLIEWNFGRIENSLRDAAAKRFGVGSAEATRLESYLADSTTGNADTPLRRVFLGMKASDVLRRYSAHVSPEEFRNLYPTLVEALHDAQAAVPGRFRRLRNWLGHDQVTADREFVRKVGESPPPYRGRGLLSLLRPHSNSRAAVRTDKRGNSVSVDSAALLPQDVQDLARRLKIMPSRIPHLMAAAAGADSRDRLGRIVEARLTPERLLAWAQSTEGRSYLEARGSIFQDNFRNRLRESGPGLVVGIASLLGAEKLADLAGLDARNHPQERFMFVVGLSHVANTATSSVGEVLLNRSLAQPFNFVTTRTVSAGGEAALQYTFEARTSFGRAVMSSLARNFALEGGLGRMAWNGLKGTALLPFRTGWGMGPGLMSAAIVDRTIGAGLLSDSPVARQWVHFGSFFLPDAYRIIAGNRGPYIFNNRLMRGASRAFAAGFIADMLFLGGNRVLNGAEGSATLNGMYARASQLHDRNRAWWARPIVGAMGMMAPSLTAYIDSHEIDGLSVVPNSYLRSATSELQSFSRNTTDQARDFIRHSLIFGTGDESLSPSYYASVDYSFLRDANSLNDVRSADGRRLPVAEVMEQLGDPAVYRRVIEGMSPDEQVAYIQRQFRGHSLSRGDVETILGRITLHRLRADIAQFENFVLPENAELHGMFDGQGRLREGRESELSRFAFGPEAPSAEQILAMRRTALAIRLVRLESEAPDSAELTAVRRVAQSAGLTDGAGRFRDAELEAEARAQLTRAAGGPVLSAVSPLGSGLPAATSASRTMASIAARRWSHRSPS